RKLDMPIRMVYYKQSERILERLYRRSVEKMKKGDVSPDKSDTIISIRRFLKEQLGFNVIGFFPLWSLLFYWRLSSYPMATSSLANKPLSTRPTPTKSIWVNTPPIPILCGTIRPAWMIITRNSAPLTLLML